MLGLMRVKNEVRWIERAVKSLLPVCERVLVFDDHSNELTRVLAKGAGAVVIPSPFEGLNETRDKNHILSLVYADPPKDGWCIMIDGDEELMAPDVPVLRGLIGGSARSLSLRILFLWDREDVVRVDGVYGPFRRPSVFRLQAGLSFVGHGPAGLHPRCVPAQLLPRCVPCGVRLKHYGYMDRNDRIRKYAWYNQIDPHNATEDAYRHMVQGDTPEVPVNARLKHAGPLTLLPLAKVR